MASEDVIELGSSDDDAEPASKKRKTLPNAMVLIPNKLPGITIKLSKSNQFGKHKGVSPKPCSKSVYNAINQANSKAVYNVNSNVIKNKPLGGAFQTSIKNFPKKTQLSVTKKCGLNPLNFSKNLIRPQLSVPLKPVINPTKVKGSKLLNNLPPGITIKLIQNAGVSEITKQCKMTAPPNTGEVLTVELDDEEISETASTTTASPQWYLRPEEPLDKVEPSDKQEHEEQTKGESEAADSMEEQNNKEPESTKFVEITIEDSPLKPLPPTNSSEIGKELSITIDDSPAKVMTNISNNDASDNENDVKKTPHSKKKLDYPKQVVEIEIEPMSTESVPVEVSDDKVLTQMSTTHKEDKIIKHDNETPNDNCKTESGDLTNQTKDSVDGTSNGEFHPVYQNFIDMCFRLENSDDMIKIVEKKIKAYYKQCPKEYVESEDFVDMVSSKIVSMKADPEKMYLYIKDIVDELNLQRKMAKSTIITKKEDLTEDSSKPEYDESAYHSKKKEQIRKLEKTIKKLHRAIQKFEAQEVDFDDDEDSVYLLTERYKERMVRVHKKFCQLTNTKMPSEPRIHIESRPGRPLGPARKLEKWVNKKVPVGSLLPFPDFHDVLRCVRDSNDEDRLGWSEYEIMEEARDLFTRCGKKLQRRRQENEWRLAASRISHNADPAEINNDLNKQLDDNRIVATSKEVELLNEFAEKQNQLKLEAVEIGDKEAEESPEESDEEEEEEEVNEISNSLEEKQKRKDKITKMLQEDNKKNVKNVNDSELLKETERENKIIDNEEQEKQINETDKTENSEPNSVINIEHPYILNACTEKSEVILENIEGDETQPGNESDSDNVESDIDELHLYKKPRKSFLPTHNAYSSFESSDSDTPIAISDTLDSDSDVETDKKLSDIISIENSSYSESESTNYNTFSYDATKNVENLINARLEVELSKEENVDHVENILLASSDEEGTNKVVSEEIGDTFINLKDDNISISETMVYGKTVEQDIVHNDELFSPEINITTTTLQESPTNSEENMIIQECYEEDLNGSLKDAAMEINKDNEEINSNGSPKDIVDIGSVSDGTSIASIEMQTDADNKVADHADADQMEVLDQPETQETEVNENSCDSRNSEVVEPIS